MVIEYLEKLEKEWKEQKNLFLEQISNLELLLKEDYRFIQVLEESSDPYFEEFSPREVNPYQKRKIKEMKDEQKEIHHSIEEIKMKIEDLEEKLKELNEVLEVARERFM